MQSKWPMVKLGEVLTQRTERPDLGKILSGEIPIVAKIGFNTGKIELREESKTKTNMILIKPGDLVISGINAAKGAIAIYGEESTKPAAATIHYSSYIINKKMADPLYLWYFMRSDIFRKILLSNLSNGIKTEVKPKRLLPIEIPLPPLVKQKQIVGMLNKLFTYINELKNERKKVSEKIRNLQLQVFEENIYRFPIVPFSEVILLKPRSGPSFPTNEEWYGTPVLMPSSVTGFGVDITKVEYGIGTELISEKDRLQCGDIIIARGNKPDQVGNAGVVPKEAEGWVCANLLMRIKLDHSRIYPFFCVYWLKTPTMRNHIKKTMKGTSPSIQKINQKMILSFQIPLPPLETQRRIVAYLDSLQAKVDELKKLQEESEKEMEELVPSILDKAFRGEL